MKHFVITTITLFIFYNTSKAQFNSQYCTYTVNDDFTYSLNVATINLSNTSQWTGSSSLTWTSQWNFGDNTTGSGQTTSHTYATPGTYTITLVSKVADLFGYCADTIRKQVTILSYPCTVNNANFTHSENHRTATLINTSTENPQFNYSYLWRFGDGVTAVADTVTHTYTADSNYTAWLIQTATNSVDNNVVCVDSQGYTIAAKDWCAAITPQVSIAYQTGQQITFKASFSSSGFNTADHYWDFGDTTTLADTAHTTNAYPYAGYLYSYDDTFTVSMNVYAVHTGSSPCFYNNVSTQAVINGYWRCDSLHASFNPSITDNNVSFTNTSQFVTAPTYYWNFGDGSVASTANPTHTYASLGTYNVMLVISYPTYVNCTDTFIQQIVIQQYGFSPGQGSLHTIDDGFLNYGTNYAVLDQIPGGGTALQGLEATYEFWYYNCPSLTTTGTIFQTQRSGNFGALRKDNSTNTTNFFVKVNAGTQYTMQGLPGLINNGWHHMAVEIHKKEYTSSCAGGAGNQAEVSLYYDGILSSTFSSTGMCFALSNYDLNIGTSVYLDEFIVTKGLKYNGVNFTPATTNATPGANILAIYHFNTAQDSIQDTRSLFFNSANGTFDLLSKDASGQVNAEEVLGVNNMIIAGHGHADRDSVCIGDTINFGFGSNVYLNPVAGIEMITATKAIVTVADTTVFIGAYIIDDLTCMQIYDTLLLHVFPAPAGNAGADTAVCQGAVVQLHAIGGVAYNWYPSAFLNNPGIDTPLANMPLTENFICVITDSNGCLNTDTVQVKVNLPPVINIDEQNSDTLLCNQQQAYVRIDSSTTSSGNIAWNVSNPISSDAYGISYWLDSTNLVIALLTDTNQCSSSDSIMIHALITPTLSGNYNDTTVCAGSAILLQSTTSADINFWDNSVADSTLIYPLASNLHTLAASNNYTTNQYPFIIACTVRDTFMLNVLPLPILLPTADTAICAGYGIQLYIQTNNTISWNGGYVNGQIVLPDSTVMFMVSISDSNNCISADSFVVNVLANPAITPLNDTIICKGNAVQFTETYPGNIAWANGYINGQFVTPITTTQYFVAVTDTNGCTSSDTATVQVIQPVTDTVPVQICSGQSYFAGGSNQVQSGYYNDTLTSATGCDSIITINLTVYPLATSAVNAEVCAGSNYLFAGLQLNIDGIYSDTLTTANGCDSIVTLTLTISPLPVLTFALPDSICNNATAITLAGTPIGGTYTGTGVNATTFEPVNALSGTNYIIYNYTDSNGCNNSIADTIIVTVCRDTNCHALYTLYPDTTTPHNWFALNQATGAAPVTYLWSWGDSTSTAGSTPSHTYSSAANYNVCLSIADANGCADTYCDSSTYIYKNEEEIIQINCVMELPNGINDADNTTATTIYPNPATETLFIATNGEVITEVNIYNSTGSLAIGTGTLVSNSIDVSKLAPGIYIAQIKTTQNIVHKRWIKN